MTEVAHALSGALLHFLWQGMVAAVFLEAALVLLRKRSANSRYAGQAQLKVLAAALEADRRRAADVR